MATNTITHNVALDIAAGLIKSAIIKQEGGHYVLYSHKGKVLGHHPSKAKAIAQEQAIKANGG